LKGAGVEGFAGKERQEEGLSEMVKAEEDNLFRRALTYLVRAATNPLSLRASTTVRRLDGRGEVAGNGEEL
jgi:hypothetical protein